MTSLGPESVVLGDPVMSVLSPLKPLLCRHAYYWSERHLADRCRRCGKKRASGDVDVDASGADGPAAPAAGTREPEPPAFTGPPPVQAPGNDPRTGPQTEEPVPKSVSAGGLKTGALVLKAQAKVRRENLLSLLERLADGSPLSQADAIDTVLAVIEDAHAAEPVLFGVGAAEQFARLNAARAGSSL